MWEKFVVVDAKESIKVRKKSTNLLSEFEMIKLRPREMKWPAPSDMAGWSVAGLWQAYLFAPRPRL